MGSRLALGVVVLIGACGPGDGLGPPELAVRDSAGVLVAEHVGADQPLDGTPGHVADLFPPDSALTAVPWGVAADPARGRIYVADWTGTRVAVFDRSGRYVESLGRAGDGPGEFRHPVAVHVNDEGVLSVWDAGRAVLSRWSSQGELVGEERAPVDYWGPGFVAGADGVVTVTTDQAGSGTSMLQRLVAVTGERQATLHEVSVELAMIRLPGITMPAPKVFAPSVVWAGGGERIHVLKGPAYRIDTYERGAPVASLRRAVPPIRVTQAMALVGVAAGPGPYAGFMRRAGLTAEQIVGAVGYEAEISAVQAIAVDPEGRLWVTRTSDGIRPRFIDILDARAGYRGTWEAPGVPVAFLSATTFVGLRLEDTGETVLGLYEVLHVTGQRPDVDASDAS